MKKSLVGDCLLICWISHNNFLTNLYLFQIEELERYNTWTHFTFGIQSIFYKLTPIFVYFSWRKKYSKKLFFFFSQNHLTLIQRYKIYLIRLIKFLLPQIISLGKKKNILRSKIELQNFFTIEGVPLTTNLCKRKDIMQKKVWHNCCE